MDKYSLSDAAWAITNSVGHKKNTAAASSIEFRFALFT